MWECKKYKYDVCFSNWLYWLNICPHAVILIIIILWSDKKAGLSKSQIGRDRDQLSGNLHTCPPHNVPPQGFVKSAPKYLSKPTGNICQNPPCLTQRRKDLDEKGPTELHRGWNDSSFLTILRKVFLYFESNCRGVTEQVELFLTTQNCHKFTCVNWQGQYDEV